MNFLSVTNWFGGKSVFFASVFTVVGIILAFLGKLTPNYIALAGAMQTLIAGRSIADDYHERNCKS